MLDFKFLFESSNRNMDLVDNMILDTENALYQAEKRFPNLEAINAILISDHPKAEILAEHLLNREIGLRNLVDHLTEMKLLKQKLMSMNPHPFHLIIMIFDKIFTAIFGILMIYNLLQYYKISSPEQNVNNLLKNKVGKNFTSKVKNQRHRQPQKSTIGKR